MIRLFRLALKRFGVDDAVFYSMLNRLVSMSSALVTLGLVLFFFSPETQGYYYTFSSMLVIQALVELGMGVTLVQYISHEWSNLAIGKVGTVEGDEAAKGRVAGMLRMAFQWYAGGAAIFFVLAGSIGAQVLSRHGHRMEVLFPWWLLCAATCLSMLQIPMRSALEGSNQFARAQRISTVVTTLSAASCWLAIVLGRGLYAVSIGAAVMAVTALVLFGLASKPFLVLLKTRSRVRAFHWAGEFWPQQWRIALSIACGYCVFYSFVPIAFYLQGAVIAGQIGASLQIYQAVNSIASSWINPRGPQLGILGARREYAKIREMVQVAVYHGRVVAALCSAVILVLLVVGREIGWTRLSGRFADPLGILLLLTAAILIQRPNIETLAVRFQKTEPFVSSSVVSGVLMLISNFVFSLSGSVTAIFAGFLGVIACVLVPWIHRIYQDHIGLRRHVLS